MDCLTDEQFGRFVAGETPPEDCAPLAAHIEQCATCNQRLEEYRANQAFAHRMAEILDVSDMLPSVGDVHISRLDSYDVSQINSDAEDRDGAHKAGLRPWGSPPASSDRSAIPGYSVGREIHRGGQGIVYQAIQEATKRKVAIKVLLEGPFSGERSRVRFKREVKLIASLKHPNIVAIHDSGLAHDRYYYVMD